MYFIDRKDAGHKLAEKLLDLKGKNAIILALPRGGVPVAHEVAKVLHLPLDIIVVRKLGVMYNPEFAFGAIAEGNIIITDENIIHMTSMNATQIENIIQSEKNELKRRKYQYKAGSIIGNKNYNQIILIDDGLATGMTMKAAIQATKLLYNPQEIIVAAPIAASDSVREIEGEVNRFITLHQSEYFGSVEQYYSQFGQTTDEEVMKLLYK